MQFLLVCALIAGDVSVTFSQQTVQAADFTDESSDEESSSTVTEEESTDDFSSGGEDSFDSEEESEAEIFGDSAETESEEETEEGLRYIKGRPLTDEEEAEQLAPFATLTDLDPGVELVGGTAVPRGYSSQTSYAETYDSRDLGLVTSVKNQGSYGICWAFSMASILETSLLAQGMGSYDLSEEHLAYFFANRQNDPLGNTAGDVNYHDGSSYYEGGNALVGSVFLSTWSGMATESVATLGTSPDVSTAYDTTAYLKDAVFSDYTESVMKALLTEYYSVSIMYYADTSGTYYNADTAAYCYGGSTGSVNHVVTVVGWDDTYEAANFADESGVTSDGAWIVKNSWGSSWGDEGYFYLSYEDPTICSLVAGTATTDPQYENNYFYDGSSGTNYVNLSVGNKLAVVFEATAGSGCMETLGEVTVTTYSDSNSFSIQVYTNLTDESVPTSGTAAYSSAYTYTQSKAGVDTISIPEVTLQQGTTYSIVVTNVGSGKIAFGYEATGSASWYSWVAATAENQSFIYSSGSWTDAVTWKECSFRIKAHTTTLSSAAQISLTNSSLSLDAGTTASIGASITPSSAQSGGITYTSGDTAVATVDSSGTVTGVGPGTTTITCVATGNSGISATCQVTVTLATPTLQVSSSSYNQVELSWTQVSGCEGYLVYRKVSGGSWTRIAKAAGTSTLTYTDSSVTVGTTYSYRIRAYVKYTSGNVYSAYAS
ncbi:MAG: Ig-like domain-containing protein, partial [Clostridiales bacterium]|nr:Ig-like domain-containing protein [Clostridiales bacterium]